MSVVVSDTSPPRYSILCGAETVLPRLFERVVIPAPTVFVELQQPSPQRVTRSITTSTRPSWPIRYAASPERSPVWSIGLPEGEIRATTWTRSPEAMTWFGIIASAKVSSTILGEVARQPLHREGWSSLCRIAHEDIERGGARSPGLEGRGHLHLDPDQRRAGTGDRRYRGAGAC